MLISNSTNFYLLLLNMIILIFSSISLYLGGLVSNDFFDAKIDLIERPSRPIPSGKIQIKYAIILMIFFFSTGFLLSLLFFNFVTAAISGLLILTILFYNYKLKNGFLRPFVMGGIRSLNILYGFSVLINFASPPTTGTSLSNLGLWTGIQTNLWPVVETQFVMLLSIVLGSVFFHVFILTLVSSRETIREFLSNSKKKPINLKVLSCSYITFLFIIGSFGFFFVEYQMAYVLFLLALGGIVVLIFYRALLRMRALETSLKMQYIVKYMILLLILLDSAFIAGISGPLVGITTASLILPSILLSRKINMT
jgi:4-hydroxybenzoate polyprenyltransferase